MTIVFNIVKEHYWRGELAALHRIRRALPSNATGSAKPEVKP